MCWSVLLYSTCLLLRFAFSCNLTCIWYLTYFLWVWSNVKMLSCRPKICGFTLKNHSRILPHSLHQNCYSVMIRGEFIINLFVFRVSACLFRVLSLSVNLALGDFPAVPTSLPPPMPVGKYLHFALPVLTFVIHKRVLAYMFILWWNCVICFNLSSPSRQIQHVLLLWYFPLKTHCAVVSELRHI